MQTWLVLLAVIPLSAAVLLAVHIAWTIVQRMPPTKPVNKGR